MQTQYRPAGQVLGQALTPANVTTLANRGMPGAVAGQPQTQEQATALIAAAASISPLPPFGQEEFQRHQYQKMRMGHIVAGAAAGSGLILGIISKLL